MKIKHALLTVALCAASLVHAETWPTKSVRLVVPVSPGGTTDLLARVVGEARGKRMLADKRTPTFMFC